MLKKICLLLLLTTPLSLSAQTADEVIAAYVKFIGGARNWHAIKTIVAKGEYNYGGIKFPFYTYSKAPDRYKLVVPFKGKYFTQVYDGNGGFKLDVFNNQTTPVILKGKPATAMANEADVELEPAFINYQRKGHQAMIANPDTLVNGSACIKIKFTRKNGDQEFDYFDKQSHAILMKSAVSKNTEMAGGVLDTYYSSYTEVEGIKIPFIATSKLKMQTVLTITVTQIKLNTDISDQTFTLGDVGKMPEW